MSFPSSLSVWISPSGNHCQSSVITLGQRPDNCRARGSRLVHRGQRRLWYTWACMNQRPLRRAWHHRSRHFVTARLPGFCLPLPASASLLKVTTTDERCPKEASATRCWNWLSSNSSFLNASISSMTKSPSMTCLWLLVMPSRPASRSEAHHIPGKEGGLTDSYAAPTD